jgi:predicted signal transduction protein with EAL and GGDEF domain
MNAYVPGGQPGCSLLPTNFAYFEVHGLEHEVPRLNLIWLVSVLLIVLAAAWQSMVRPQRAARSEMDLGPIGRWMRFILPILAIGIDGLSCIARIRHRPESWVAQLGLALTLLVMMRQFLAIHEATRMYDVARGQAIRDALTGAFNRRFFDEALDREVEQARRYAHPLSLIVVDIDGFKAFNDTYGHPAGEVLDWPTALREACGRPISSPATEAMNSRLFCLGRMLRPRNG